MAARCFMVRVLTASASSFSAIQLSGQCFIDCVLGLFGRARCMSAMSCRAVRGWSRPIAFREFCTENAAM